MSQATKTKTQAKTAEITNIGPIERLKIPVPEGGGIVCFRGANGTGKSTALSAIDAAISGNGRPPVRDKQVEGEFSGFGVTLTIGRSKRRKGEAEVHSLEGRLSIADLVDPGIADPEKADAHRIKALVQLAGCKADPSLFHPLVADLGQFDSLISPAAIAHTDIIAMAGAIKRDLEAAARKAGDEAENLASRAEAARKSAEGHDLDGECDQRVLQRDLELAIGAKATIEAEAEAAARACRVAEQAGTMLERAASEYKGPTAAEAQAELDAAETDYETALTEQREAEQRLREAKARVDARMGDITLRRQRLDAAKNHERLTAQWREQIHAGASATPVPASALLLAKTEVETAREALVNGGLIAHARQQIKLAEEAADLAKQHKERSEKLREAAKGTDGVLSKLVAKSGVPLRVEPVDQRIRLTLGTKRGCTCFGELSDGERWRIALDIAINAVGQGGEITIPQHAWEALDPVNRAAVAERLRAGGVIAYTAEATDGELRAELFGGNGHAA